MAAAALALLLVAPRSRAAADPPAQGFEELGSMEAMRRMGMGWNLGNTLEACGDWIKGKTVHDFETAWGNPDTTRAMIAGVRKAGFKSVRIPVAWSNMMGPGYAIHPALLRRVAEVVAMVQAEGMVPVVNIHWDGGWWKGFETDYGKAMDRYTRMWGQIAGHFKDYPGTLILESLNEEGQFKSVWDHDTKKGNKAKAYGMLLDINQHFVDLVRASGGLNARRHLLIAGYVTDIGHTTDPLFKMPKDPAGHCMVSVHYYTPWPFAGMEKDESWGKMRPTWGTPADLKELDTMFAKLKARFLDKGVPVIVGEFGMACKKSPEQSRNYVLAVAKKAYGMGLCPMLWDAGGYFDRRKLRFFDPAFLDGLQKIMAGRA